jgi:uncharacterized membrane protein YccC
VRWPVAVQAALAMGLPVAIFAAVGQPQLGLMASTGGFTALYFAGHSRRERARLLPLVAGGLIVSSCSERIRMRFRFDEDTRVIVFRVTLASAIAIVVAAPLGVHRVYWVLLTVIAILQNGRRLRLTALRGVHRILGTLVGVGLFALVLLAHPEGLLLALLLAVLQFIVELVVIRNYGLALVFITPLALIIAAQGQPADVGGVVVTRLLDTLLGAGIAMVVLLVALVVRYPRRPAS